MSLANSSFAAAGAVLPTPTECWRQGRPTWPRIIRWKRRVAALLSAVRITSTSTRWSFAVNAGAAILMALPLVGEAGEATATFGVTLTIVPAQTPAAAAPADPLAGGTWEALQGPWPGTMSFNSEARSVHIAPRGASPVDASYGYTFEEGQASDAQASVRRGRLHIKRTNGLEAELTFLLSKNGRILTLLFNGGAEAQRYVRTDLPGLGGEEKSDTRGPADATARTESPVNKAVRK